MGVGGLDGGGPVDMFEKGSVGYVGNVVREEAAGGRAALAVSCVVGSAGAYEPAVDVFALRQNPKTRSYIVLVLVGILP
jgi:hypothetical protein